MSLLQTYTHAGETCYDFPLEMWQDALGVNLDPTGSGLTVVFCEEYGGPSDFLSSKQYDLLSVFMTGGRGDFLARQSKALVWEDTTTEKRGEAIVKTRFGKREEEAGEEEEGGVGEKEQGEGAGKGKAKEGEDDAGDGLPLETAQTTISPTWTHRLRKREGRK